MSDDAVSYTGGVVGAGFFSLSISFTALSLTVVAVAVAGVGVLAGSATGAVASKLVRTEIIWGKTDSGTGGVGSLLLVSFVFPDMKIAAATCSTKDSQVHW
jgi:hypothetical protein